MAMPSPPTVSPLSTPAVTHVNTDDEFPVVSTSELPPAAAALYLPQEQTAMPPSIGHDAHVSPLVALGLAESPFPDQDHGLSRAQFQAIATTDPEPKGDYALQNNMMRQAQGSVDPNAYIMSLAAQAALFQTQGPSVVAPSDVSLHSFTQDSDALTGSADPASASASASQKLESFAKIEFADSVFQMTTYSVIIGRDQRAMDQARIDEKREASYRRKVEENARHGLPPPTPLQYDKGKFSKSYVSEEGGMLGPECSDNEDDMPPPMGRRPSSGNPSVNGGNGAPGDHVMSSRQYVSHTPGAAAVELGTMQPSPGHIPFVGIHSPGPDIASKTRGISRQHLKIQFDKEKGVFLGMAMHKNGFFCEDAHYGLDDHVTLRSGDRLQIKDVEFRFIINGVETGKTGGEEEEVVSSKRMSIGGQEMSLDFEHSDHENFQDTSESLSEVENIPTPIIASDDSEPEEKRVTVSPVQRAEEPAAQVVETTGMQVDAPLGLTMPEQPMPELPIMPEVPKRRGPGRPPKDGIMSKRERRLLKKQLQETSRKTVPQDPQNEKIKRPVGRPRKNPLPEDGERPEKRKYNKRKPKEEGEEGSDAERIAREKKDKKARPKSPPLQLFKSDYTEEQLQKPTKNYGVLIDETLTNGPAEGLTLKQIYKRIMKAYPWYFFYSETKGWESSVRHNLIGNDAFLKTGETGLWRRIPGIELDAGKKRKANSPDQQGGSHPPPHLSQPHLYQNGHYPSANVNPTAGMPGYANDIKQPQPRYPLTSQGPLAQVMSTQGMAQQAYPAQVPAPAQLPPGYGASTITRPPNVAQQSTYSSPYARPPPPANPSIKSETTTAGLQALPSASPPQALGVTNGGQVPQQPLQSLSLSPENEKVVGQFRENMVKALMKTIPQAAQVVDGAIRRARGIPGPAPLPGCESTDATLVKAVQTMIKDLLAKQARQTKPPGAPSASPAPFTTAATASKSTPTPGPTPVDNAKAEVQGKIKSFRDSMVKSLGSKTDQAEMIVDSAVNRAQGLPHVPPMKGWEQADELIFQSVVKLLDEARIELGQQSTPTPAPTTQPGRSTSSAPRPAYSASPVQARTSQPGLQTAPAANMQPSGFATKAPVQGTAVQPTATPSPRPAMPSVSRPGISIQRPTTTGSPRPGSNAVSRPPMMPNGPMANLNPPDTAALASSRNTLGSAPSTTGYTGFSELSRKPPVSLPSVSNAATPSAGVVDQITGQRRPLTDAPNNGPGPSNGNTAGAPGKPDEQFARTPVQARQADGSGPSAALAPDLDRMTPQANGNTIGNGAGTATQAVSTPQMTTTTTSAIAAENREPKSSGAGTSGLTSPNPVEGSEHARNGLAAATAPVVRSGHSPAAASTQTPEPARQPEQVRQPEPTRQQEPARKPEAPSAPSVSSPAPPSAGVLDQIAGQKRPRDEGPGGSGDAANQRETKKLAVSPA
ncbi:hypothetical protein GGR56DRAFT_653378 [Xylariaceae sp. FL0804]|nr:hypothetical protein GGR56DRAFT_653378 [Xylariaceae sp. FL0804]